MQFFLLFINSFQLHYHSFHKNTTVNFQLFPSTNTKVVDISFTIIGRFHYCSFEYIQLTLSGSSYSMVVQCMLCNISHHPMNQVLKKLMSYPVNNDFSNEQDYLHFNNWGSSSFGCFNCIGQNLKKKVKTERNVVAIVKVHSVMKITIMILVCY